MSKPQYNLAPPSDAFSSPFTTIEQENDFSSFFSADQSPKPPKRRQSIMKETSSDGSPFLLPPARKTKKKSFFLTRNQNPSITDLNTERFNDALRSLDRLSPQQLNKLANEMELKIQNAQKLNARRANSPPSPDKAHQLLSAIQEVRKKKDMDVPNLPPQLLASTRPSLGSVDDYPINDIRYLAIPSSQILIDEPLAIGMEDFNYSIELGREEQSHIIIQCFELGYSQPRPMWPKSLRIFVNQMQIKSLYYQNSLVDITDFLPELQLTIKCDVEGKQYALIIRAAIYKSVDTLVTEVMANIAPSTYLDMDQIDIYDPITGQVINFPAIGKKCKHPQCFDLKVYIEMAIRMNVWECPVCHEPAPLADLRYRKDVYDYITELRRTCKRSQFTTDDMFELKSFSSGGLFGSNA